MECKTINMEQSNKIRDLIFSSEEIDKEFIVNTIIKIIDSEKKQAWHEGYNTRMKKRNFIRDFIHSISSLAEKHLAILCGFFVVIFLGWAFVSGLTALSNAADKQNEKNNVFVKESLKACADGDNVNCGLGYIKADDYRTKTIMEGAYFNKTGKKLILP